MSNALVHGRGNIDERTVTICSGTDFVQISHTNITGADTATAKVSDASIERTMPIGLSAAGLDRRDTQNYTQS